MHSTFGMFNKAELKIVVVVAVVCLATVVGVLSVTAMSSVDVLVLHPSVTENVKVWTKNGLLDKLPPTVTKPEQYYQ